MEVPNQQMNMSTSVKPNIDVSVVLNMHREGPFIKATLASLNACAQTARAGGLKCELIAVFDRSDESTIKVFTESSIEGFAKHKVVHTDVGSLGLARNAGIDHASGEYIWTADGDDLVSSNAMLELHRLVSAKGPGDYVAYVNYLVAFGEIFFVSKYFDGDHLTVADFAMDHPFVSRIFIKRSVFSKLRYIDLRLTEGFAYEDWEFVTRLRREGFQFLVAPDTAMYYRQRPQSLLRQANGLSAKLIPHTPLFEPKWYAEELARERSRIGDWQSFVQMRHDIHRSSAIQEVMSSPQLRADLLRANLIDPEVDLARIEGSHSHIAVPYHSDHWGFALAEAFEIVGDAAFTDVVLLPWLNPGGGEKYILQVLQELADAQPESRFLVLCGEPAQAHGWSNRLPRRSVLLDVVNAFPTLNDEARDKLVARLLLATTSPGTRLHIKSSVFAHRLLDTYGSVLLTHFQGVYYRFSDGQYVWENHKLTYWSTLRLLRRDLPRLSKVICDCASIARRDKERIGLAHERYHVVYAHANSPRPSSFATEPRKRLLWASRVCGHKRPELLARLARKLKTIFPDVEIDAYGSAEEGYDPRVLFDTGNLSYLGPFESFDSLPLENYDAFIYTSELDGLPNVLLEAMAARLPVVAPDVGGIGELVISGKTGFLIADTPDDEKLIDRYALAIRDLYDDWDATRHLATSAKELVDRRHSYAAFSSRIAAVFGITNTPVQVKEEPVLNANP
ncbi:glycosyltransferase [Caballeronia ptereochthonis]|uniref:Glycosyltransferase, group 1 family protein n=1 Tax=Caballeronia ptereochthonis TaxID=1777144 RepID=A0A158BJT8_9BURK|nr:glycosyltransferase [Caballeronia ptereochthonis]SAK69597.1 glycosyltransferase, group 1 family protein [Caballeronia ptereochthonis]